MSLNRPAASIARLMEIKDVTEEDAKHIRFAWSCNSRRLLDSDAVKAWSAQNPPMGFNTVASVRRRFVDHILRTYGVEYLGLHKRNGENVYYCNAGDTYATTVIFVGKRLLVGCMGDYVDKVKPFEQP